MARPLCGPVSDRLRFRRRTVRLTRALEELKESRNSLINELKIAHELIDQKNTEVAEAHHRVKNCIQTAMAILKMQADIHADGDQHGRLANALNEASQRLTYIARAHEMLYEFGAGKQSIEMSSYLSDICADFASAHAMRPVQLVVSAEPLKLDVRRAVSVALIVVEGVTNAYKHAFPGGQGGAVKVELRKIGGDRVVLGVSDDGIGFQVDGQEGSVGMKILRSFSRNLGGEAVIEGRAGTRIVVEFPL